MSVRLYAYILEKIDERICKALYWTVLLNFVGTLHLFQIGE